MADKEWILLPEGDALVSQAIQQWHQRLDGAHILVVGRPTATKSHGKVVWGKLKRANNLEKVLYWDDLDYLVIVPVDMWSRLPEPTRLALIDHELCHAGGWDPETEQWTVRAHDLEEFAQVVRRHGAWKDDVAYFLEQTQEVKPAQMNLAEAVVEGASSDAFAERLRPKPGSDLDSDGRTEKT